MTPTHCPCGAPPRQGRCARCKRFRTVSKYVSKHLRHQPERIGLTIGPEGWVAVDELLAAAAYHGFPLERAELEQVVASNDKQRFAFDATRTLIRANQGHSVAIDLNLPPEVPPPVLYHGTGQQTVAAIVQMGLHKMSRHHVHLSGDIETARIVGARHGSSVVFEVDTPAMVQAGFVFYRSANGVWLVDHVPPVYLRPL